MDESSDEVEPCQRGSELEAKRRPEPVKLIGVDEQQFSEGWPRSHIPGVIARAEIQNALGHDAEAALSVVYHNLDDGSYDVVYHHLDETKEAIEAFFRLRPCKITLIRGFDARERIEHMFGCSPDKAMDILIGWIREGRIRAYPVNAPYDYDDTGASEEAADHIFKYGLDIYLTESDLMPEKIENVDFKNMSVRESELNEMLESKPLDETFSGPAWEPDKSRWTPLEVSVHQVAEASGLPHSAARAMLFQAVNAGRTYALYAVYPGREPSGWFRTHGNPRLVDPAPPETVVDPLSLAAWIAAEYPPAVPGSNEEKPRRKRGRKPKPIWDTIRIEATRHVAFESSDSEPMIQADLERYIEDRLQAHGENAAESTIRLLATSILETLQKADN